MAEGQFEHVTVVPFVKLEVENDIIDDPDPENDCELVPEADPIAFEPIKHRQGKALESGEKIMAYNIFLRYLSQKESKTRSAELAAHDVGIANGTMWKIISEIKNKGRVSSPSRTRRRTEGKQLGRKETLNEDDKNKILETIQSFVRNDEIPTVDKVLKTLQHNKEFPPITRTTLYRYIKKLGYSYEKRGS